MKRVALIGILIVVGTGCGGWRPFRGDRCGGSCLSAPQSLPASAHADGCGGCTTSGHQSGFASSDSLSGIYGSSMSDGYGLPGTVIEGTTMGGFSNEGALVSPTIAPPG